MKNRKLLYCSNSTLPSKTANSIHVMEMASSFSKVVDQVILTGYINKNAEKSEIFNFYGKEKTFKLIDVALNLRFSRLSSWYSAMRCLIFAFKTQPDFIYGRSLHSIYLLSLFGFRGGYESHSTENQSKVSRFLFKGILRRKNIKYIITKSEALRLLILEEFGMKYKEKIISFHDGASVGSNLKFNLNIKNNNFNVGYVGHLYKGRGIQLIIELAKALTEFNFHIVGGNNDNILYWKNEVENLENVFFHGFIEPKYMTSVRDQMDILIAPYENEVSISGNKGDTSRYMSPLKVFEYMAAKKPMITSDHEVLKEVLLHNVNALMLPVSDLEAWKSALQTLSESKELRQKLAKNAFEKFVTSYSWDIRAKKIYKLLSEG